MTALSDALAAAQARAVAALAKQYIGGKMDSAEVATDLAAIGLRDEVDAEQWLHALDLIREAGGEAPAEAKPPTNGREPEPATDSQLSYIGKLADDKGYAAPEGPLTKDQASSIITALKAGTYNPDEYAVPF
ncbi:MAG: hypothetical protein ACRDUT_00140 [Mycobacterium sp.]